MKKVSVILTTYNSERYLNRTLNSIYGQKGIGQHFEVELIIVDDCSTDSTVSFLKKKKIPYLSTGQNSGGPNKGRNIGLKNASGDYICIADHDDVWKENRIISLRPEWDKVPIVSSGHTLINNSTKKKIERSIKVLNGYIRYLNSLI